MIKRAFLWFYFLLPSRLRKRKKIFILCPVREIASPVITILAGYVARLEAAGHRVYWPYRDTDQVDPIGLRICRDNRRGMRRSDVVYVCWDKESKGSHFDLGIAFVLGKPLVLINSDQVRRTEKKSFDNVLLALTRRISY